MRQYTIAAAWMHDPNSRRRTSHFANTVPEVRPNGRYRLYATMCGKKLAERRDLPTAPRIQRSGTDRKECARCRSLIQRQNAVRAAS